MPFFYPLVMEPLPAKFGPLLLTDGITAWSGESGLNVMFLTSCLAKYAKSDWGSLNCDDQELNNEAIEDSDGGRIMGSYEIPADMLSSTAMDDKLWIITSGYGNNHLGVDHCYTTVLWPSEY